MGKVSQSSDTYSEAEATKRTEAALRAAFTAPHKTYEESKLGKRKSPARKSPRKRKAVEKPR
jgi:hypothetical protein